MGSKNYFQAIRPDVGQIRKLIDNGLLFDWAIRIEFVNGNSETTTWQQWENSFFALHSAEPVLVALMDCYTRNPRCLIRLNAEKFSTQTRMLYTAYNPMILPAPAVQKSRRATLVHQSVDDGVSRSTALSI